MDILFTSPNHFNIFSEGIKMVEDREFSHTAIRWFDPIIKRTVIFHSTIKGVVFYSESRFLEKNKIVEAFTLDLDADSEVEIKAWCHDMAGGHYDYLGILKSAINKVLIAMGLKEIAFKGNGTDYMFCSELVARAFYAFINEYVTPEELDLLGPSGLNKILKMLISDNSNIVKVI